MGCCWLFLLSVAVKSACRNGWCECPRCVVVMGELWVVVGYFSCLLPWKAHVEMDGVIDSFFNYFKMGVFCFDVFGLVEKQNPLCTY